MASATPLAYGNFLVAALNGEIDLDDDDVRILHTSSAHTPNQDTHAYEDDLTNEVTGTNLPAGGVAVSNLTVGYTGATNKVTIDHDDFVVEDVTASDIKNSHWVDRESGNVATNPLLFFATWDTALSPEEGALSIFPHANGLYEITLA